MKIEAIKIINITLLFSAPINHLLISQKILFELLEGDGKANSQHTFIEAPGLKVAASQNSKKEIAFEGMRLLINDKSEASPENSDVTDIFQKIIKSDMVEKDKIVAYGFNYDVIVTPGENGFKVSDFLGKKIRNIANIKNAGISLWFEEGKTAYFLEVKPIGSEQKFFAHFNVHFNLNTVPKDKNKLTAQMQVYFKKLEGIINKI